MEQYTNSTMLEIDRCNVAICGNALLSLHANLVAILKTQYRTVEERLPHG